MPDTDSSPDPSNSKFAEARKRAREANAALLKEISPEGPERAAKALEKVRAKAAEVAAKAEKRAAKEEAAKEAELKAKHASLLQKLTTTPPPIPPKKKPPRPGAFTENERAWLLKGVIDALVKRCNPGWSFKIWHRHGLSRLYFADHSWLSFGTNGVCKYGVNDPEGGYSERDSKETTAYEVRRKLGLAKSAKRGPLPAS